MKLNLTLIKGKLPSEQIRYSKLEKRYSYPLEFAMLYEGGAFVENYLYIVHAEELPEIPEFRGHCSLLVIGEVTDVYKESTAEICCVADDVPLARLFNAVSWIFQEYQVWESQLDQALYEKKDFKRLGQIIYEQFQNPVDLLNVSDRYLFRIYDRNRPENREYYELFTESEYPLVEELQILYSLPEQMETYTFQEPVLLKNPMYSENYLHANLFVDGRFVGKLFVSDVYHPLQEADYALIQYLAEKLKDAVDETATTVIVHSQEMENIIRKLAQGEMTYTPAEKIYLERQHWNQYDKYQLAILQCPSEIKGNRQLSAHAVYLHNLLVDVFPLVIGNRIFMVLHGVTEDDLDREKYRLQQFLMAEGYRCGYSDLFSDFASLAIHYTQAQWALELGTASSGISYEFPSHVMKCIYQICLDTQELSFFMTERLKQLKKYDEKNQTELYRTLRCYLENGLNVAKTLKILYIHRSTFTYRLEKIEKLLKCSLNNYKTRLYLQFAMELEEYAEKLQEQGKTKDAKPKSAN